MRLRSIGSISRKRKANRFNKYDRQLTAIHDIKQLVAEFADSITCDGCYFEKHWQYGAVGGFCEYYNRYGCSPETRRDNKHVIYKENDNGN